MNAQSPPSKPDTIYYSPSLGLAGTNQREGDIPYVPASTAAVWKAQRDALLEAARIAERMMVTAGWADVDATETFYRACRRLQTTIALCDEGRST